MNISDIIASLGLIIACLTSLFGVIAWLINSAKRRYGLERDFAHIKGNYEQINKNLKIIIEEIDERFDSLERILIKTNNK